MTNRNVQMLTIAEEFIRKLKLNVVYASVGGSVGRGEADKYSDLDITVYTDSNVSLNELNIFYDDEIIQLEILHIKIGFIPLEKE